MQRYRVTGMAASVNGGVVELTDEQADRRRHNLEDAGNGCYRVLAGIQFKHGEEFGFDGELPKGMANVLAPAGESDAAAIEKPEGDDLILAIQLAVEELPQDAANFTRDGKPKLPVLAAALGYKITRDELAQALAGMEAA